MRDRDLEITRLLLVSFAGALILEVILTFATGLRVAFTIRQIPADLAALLVGALAGFLFELFREMTTATKKTLRIASETQKSLEVFAARITYQDEALKILTKCPRHNDALTKLIKASIVDNFRNVPLVGEPAYFEFLTRAIVHSNGYEGIQRKPLSWFMEKGGGGYLSDLKQRNMQYKIRLLILDEADLNQWQADLRDEECLKYYWGHSGSIKTYWMTATDFMDSFPAWETVPKDLALYDRQLLISYDERIQLLSFDVLDEQSKIGTLFDSIKQLAQHEAPKLHELSMPT